jgi:hypothetical protein
VYNSDAELSEYEEKAISLYEALHDEIYEFRESWLKNRKDIAIMHAELKELRAAFEKLEDATKLYGELAGYEEEEILTFSLPEEEYELRPRDLQNQVMDFKVLVDNYWERTEPVSQLFNKIYNKDEEFDINLEHFCNEYFSPIIHNWENVEIDTVSLDRDLDNFREALSPIFKLQQDTIDERNVWIEEHNATAIAIGKLYDRIEKVLHNAHPLTVFGAKSEFGSFSDN